MKINKQTACENVTFFFQIQALFYINLIPYPMQGPDSPLFRVWLAFVLQAFWLQFRALFMYYRYYHGVFTDQLKSIISPEASFVRYTQLSNAHHSSTVKLDRKSTKEFANFFIPMTSKEQNSTIFSRSRLTSILPWTLFSMQGLEGLHFPGVTPSRIISYH